MLYWKYTVFEAAYLATFSEQKQVLISNSPIPANAISSFTLLREKLLDYR